MKTVHEIKNEETKLPRLGIHINSVDCADKTVKAEVSTESVTGNFIIIDYSTKALALFGDTRPIKNQLTAIGGRFNPKLIHKGVKTAGWVFSKTKKQKLRSLVTIK